MLKFKVAVNPILISRIAVFFAFLTPYLVFAKNPAYVLAEYSLGKYTILERAGNQLTAPVGSLLKPFAAWYLLENGVNPQQTIFCPPEIKRTATLRCWTPSGHGAMSLQTALAQSCNYYFLSQFLGRNLAEYDKWLRERFLWPHDLPIAKPAHVYGFDLAHGIEPEKLLAMYAKFLHHAENGNTAAQIVASGLKEICLGTLVDFCRQIATRTQYRFILGKTGTVQTGKKNFGTAILYLEHLPKNKKILLLCYEKNKIGSETALNALVILDAYNRKTHN